jgi:hypothetical protein
MLLLFLVKPAFEALEKPPFEALVKSAFEALEKPPFEKPLTPSNRYDTLHTSTALARVPSLPLHTAKHT